MQVLVKGNLPSLSSILKYNNTCYVLYVKGVLTKGDDNKCTKTNNVGNPNPWYIKNGYNSMATTWAHLTMSSSFTQFDAWPWTSKMN